MTTRLQRELAAAETRGRDSAYQDCEARIRQAKITESFNVNIVVTVRKDQLLGETAAVSEITKVLSDYVHNDLIARYQLSVTQVIAGANR